MPKLAYSHAPALVCLLLVQRPADTKAITTDFDPNGILRAHMNVQAHTHTDVRTFLTGGRERLNMIQETASLLLD